MAKITEEVEQTEEAKEVEILKEKQVAEIVAKKEWRSWQIRRKLHSSVSSSFSSARRSSSHFSSSGSFSLSTSCLIVVCIGC